MNRDDLKKFRTIFEEDMNREGFIWKYQTYLHVDFDQYWILAIWPGVAAQGHVFDMYHRMFLMNCFDEEDLKQIHSDNLFSMGRIFNITDPKSNRGYPFNEFENTEESYQTAFEIYCRDVNPIVHQIQSSYDAYLYKREYVSFSFEKEWMWFSKGQVHIEYLLPLKREDEIQEVMTKIKKGQIVWERRYNNREPPVYKEPSLRGYSRKSAARAIEIAKRIAQHEMEQYQQEKQAISETRQKIRELENMLQTTDHEELSKQVLERMENVSSMLRNRFSKKEKEVMNAGWRKN